MRPEPDSTAVSGAAVWVFVLICICRRRKGAGSQSLDHAGRLGHSAAAVIFRQNPRIYTGCFVSYLAMRTGISTLVDLEVPLPRLLELIASTGFDAVGLCHNVEHAGYHTPHGRRELKRLLETYGLHLDYIHPPIQPYYDLTALDEQV